jgi:putative membrane protein insertion efficiency factor
LAAGAEHSSDFLVAQGQRGSLSASSGWRSILGLRRQVRRGNSKHRLKPMPPELQNLGVRMALFALRFYKAYLSMLFAGSCRFEPTCSRYSYEAVERFGVLRGSWLTLKRLLRCQPLSRKFGFDPVPETWEDTPISSAAAGGGRSIGANEVHS